MAYFNSVTCVVFVASPRHDSPGTETVTYSCTQNQLGEVVERYFGKNKYLGEVVEKKYGDNPCKLIKQADETDPKNANHKVDTNQQPQMYSTLHFDYVYCVSLTDLSTISDLKQLLSLTFCMARRDVDPYHITHSHE